VANSDKQTVGVVGVGHLGAAMARRLLRVGYPVVVFDVRPERIDALIELGASGAASLEELGRAADVVVIAVSFDHELKDVVDNLAPVVERGTSFVVHSTVLPMTIVALAEEMEKAGLALVDAPITGGAEKAELGTLTLMVGGASAAVTEVWPLLESLGTNLFYVGPAGAGAVIKVVNNLMSYGTYALALEAMSIAEAFGIDEETVTEVLCTGAADSRVLHTWGRTDRTRADPEAGSHHIPERASDNIRVAAISGAAKGLVLPLASVLIGTIGEKVRVRDAELARRGRVDAPRCSVCNQELAKPFRDAGVHTECAHPLPIQNRPPAVTAA